MNNKQLGIFYLFISGLFFMAMQVCIKYVPNIPVIQIAFFRGLITLVFCGFYFQQHQGSPFGKKKNRTLLLMRGFFGSAALLSFFYTLKHLPLATAANLQYLSPIFTVLVAAFFVKELPTKKQFIYLIFAFVGTVLLKGFSTEAHSAGIVLIGVLAALSAAIAYNTIRKMGKTEDHMVIIFYFPLILLPLIIIPTMYYWHSPSWIELLLLIGVGCFTHGGQVFMTKAYQIEKASNIVTINYLGSIYAVILGALLFNEMPTLTALIGIAMIVLSAYLSTTSSKAKT